MNKTEKKSFIKLCSKAFLSHMASIIVCLVICFSLCFFMTNTGGFIFVGIIALFVYTVTMYSTYWELGYRDKNMAKLGHIKHDKYRGFKISLIANIPIYLVSVLTILSKVIPNFNILIVFKLINAPIWPIAQLINESSMSNKVSWLQLILIVLLPFIYIIINGITYQLGLKDYAPVQALIYKKNKKKDNTATTKRTVKR